MCNYADDITFHACQLNLKCLVKKLEHDSMLASGWSVSNYIPLNENKCLFLLSRCRHEMSLLNRVPSVPTCQRGLRANVPKTCQLFIFMCQRANKRANVPYGAPMFQIGVPTCQKACQFFKHCSYEMLRKISILYY